MSDSNRRCGKCQECCVVIDVKPLNKPANVRCRHMATRGCGIYEKRPRCCAVFTCGWLEGALPNHLRPDKIGGFAWMTQLIGTEPGHTLPLLAVSCRASRPVNAELRAWAIEHASANMATSIQHGEWTELYAQRRLVARWKHNTQFIHMDFEDGVLTTASVVEQAAVLDTPEKREQYERAQKEAETVQEAGS